MAHGPQDKIDRLFGEALSHPPGRRGAFLEERCDEPEVRQRVAALLADYEAATDLFDGLADAALAPMLCELEAEAGDEGTRSADPLDLKGTQVGRYRIEEHLGGGGMGVVYRARDLDLSRPVALKFLPPHLAAHPEAEERFVREARAAAALDHSNIATVHEIGETEGGRRFIAMSYYDGETLKETLKDGLLPVEDVLDYAEQIAEGLARAHEAGIAHRDVKPANVMVTEGGAVKLVDFGLAQVTGQSRLTDPGRRVGTAAYMSPEQAEGDEIDARTDLWALGVVLYEMLAGERPFEGERETAVLHAILHEEPAPVGTRRSKVPPRTMRSWAGPVSFTTPWRRTRTGGVRQSPRRRRGGAGAVRLRPESRPAGPAQGPTRPGQPLAGESYRRACSLTGRLIVAGMPRTHGRTCPESFRGGGVGV